MKPAQRAVRLAILLARSLPGGIDRAEGKALASEALALAGQLAALYAPPVVAPIVGAVLTWTGAAIASPPVMAGDALASLLAAVAGHVPDLDVEAAPVPTPEPGAGRVRPVEVVAPLAPASEPIPTDVPTDDTAPVPA